MLSQERFSINAKEEACLKKLTRPRSDFHFIPISFFTLITYYNLIVK